MAKITVNPVPGGLVVVEVEGTELEYSYGSGGSVIVIDEALDSHYLAVLQDIFIDDQTLPRGLYELVEADEEPTEFATNSEMFDTEEKADAAS